MNRPVEDSTRAAEFSSAFRTAAVAFGVVIYDSADETLYQPPGPSFVELALAV